MEVGLQGYCSGWCAFNRCLDGGFGAVDLAVVVADQRGRPVTSLWWGLQVEADEHMEFGMGF